MADLDEAVADEGAAALEAMGTPITYIPYATGVPISTVCFLKPPLSPQPSGLPMGYFAEIALDPAVVPNPQLKDVVIWPDDVVYRVSKTVTPSRGLITVSLHRQFDK